MTDTKRGRLATAALETNERAVVYHLRGADANVDILIANGGSGPAKLKVAVTDGVDRLECLYIALQRVIEGQFPFDVEYQKGGEGETVTGLLLTWREGGVISGTACLSDDDAISIDGMKEAAGTEATEEVQRIAITAEDLTIGEVWTLTCGSDSITAAALEAATVADLVTKIQSASGYSALPFTVAANGTAGLELTWKAIEVVEFQAALNEAGGAEFSATVYTEGGIPGQEIQSITISNDDISFGAEFTLEFDNVTATTGPVSLEDLPIDEGDYVVPGTEVGMGHVYRINDLSMSSGEAVIAKSSRRGVAVRVSGTEQSVIA
jgi:hypothetical protein